MPSHVRLLLFAVLLLAVGGHAKSAKEHRRRIASLAHAGQHSVVRHRARALVAIMVSIVQHGR